MDKDYLAVIGKLYVDNLGLSNFAEALKGKISELEKQLEQHLDKKLSQIRNEND